MIRSTLHKMCKQFREETLFLTLADMERITGVKVGTISAFENGRSNNINHLYLYVMACPTEQHVKDFEIDLIKELTGNDYE